MRMTYAEQATIKVSERWGYKDEVVVSVARDCITVTPPVLPSSITRERTQKLARLLASAAARGVSLHRRMFGRGPA